jgi:hypothetical protein
MRVNMLGKVPQRSMGKLLSTLAVGASVLTLALLFSASINLFGPKLSLVWAALIIGPVLLFVRLEWLMWAMIVSTFLVVGTLQYFFGVQKAFWIPYLLGVVLLVRLPIDLMTQRRRDMQRRRTLSPPLVAFFMLLLGLTASTVINAPAPFQILFGFRDYFAVMSLMLVIGAGLVDRRFVARVWTFLLWVVPLQIPAVIYQRFFVANERLGASPWDAVVGLFGGDPEGGGGSGVMALFVIVMAFVALMRWRNKQIGTPFFALVVLSALGCIALAEVKFSFLLIPISVALIFGRDLLRKPVRVLLAFIATGVFLVAIISLYQAQFTYSSSVAAKETLAEYVERTFANNLDDRFINYNTGEMGRVAALRFWEKEHGIHDPVKYVLGHGVGSTKMGGFVRGEAASKYSVRIDRSTAAIILWDGGVFGLMCMGLLLYFASRMAFRLSSDERAEQGDRALMPAMGVAAVLLLLELPYQTAVANAPQTQLLLAMVVGYIVLIDRKASVVSPSAMDNALPTSPASMRLVTAIGSSARA